MSLREKKIRFHQHRGRRREGSGAKTLQVPRSPVAKVVPLVDQRQQHVRIDENQARLRGVARNSVRTTSWTCLRSAPSTRRPVIVWAGPG